MSISSGRYGASRFRAVLSAMLILIALIAATGSAQDGIAISATKLHGMMEKHLNFDLVDVRQPSEYNAGHISGAKLIPLNRLLNGDFKLNKDDLIVLYCHSGRRSDIALKYLEEYGYKNVEHLEGGILTWKYDLAYGPEQNILMGDDRDAVFGNCR